MVGFSLVLLLCGCNIIILLSGVLSGLFIIYWKTVVCLVEGLDYIGGVIALSGGLVASTGLTGLLRGYSVGVGGLCGRNCGWQS